MEVSLKSKGYSENNHKHNTEQRKENYNKNKKKIAEKKKKYDETHKEEIKEYWSKIITCECGCEITQKSLTRHKKTAKHIKLMENIKV